jgi:transposase
MSTTSDAACPAAPALPNEPTIWAVDDMLWTTVGPLLVIDKPRKKSGRPRHDDRRILNGLIWLARTGSQWSQVPRQFGPTSTAHARFQEWVAYGVFARAWAQVLAAYDAQVGLTWEWQAADGCLITAPGGKKLRR